VTEFYFPRTISWTTDNTHPGFVTRRTIMTGILRFVTVAMIAASAHALPASAEPLNPDPGTGNVLLFAANSVAAGVQTTVPHGATTAQHSGRHAYAAVSGRSVGQNSPATSEQAARCYGDRPYYDNDSSGWLDSEYHPGVDCLIGPRARY
jgi:hypothetical protein